MDSQLQLLTQLLTQFQTASLGPETDATSIYVISTHTRATWSDATTVYVTSTETRATSSTLISSQITDVPSSTSSQATVSSDASKATVSFNPTSTSDQLNAGAKAGTGVGVSLGILLLGALVAYITILRRRLKKASRENAPPAGPAVPPHGIPELGSEGQKYELMGDKAWKASPVGPDGRTHAHELES